MTLLAHIYAVRELIGHGVPSDDFSYSDRLIAHFLKISRAKLIEQKTDKYSFISNQSYQDLCLDLELSNFHGCCDTTTECFILKSMLEIPKFLNSRWGNFIKIMDLNGEVIPEITLTQNKWSEYSLTPKNPVGWFMHNNHIYLVNAKILTKVLLNALFDDPEVIAKINCTVASTCDTLSETFPIDSDLIAPMYMLTLEFLTKSQSIPNDVQNNSKDDAVLYNPQ